MNFEKNYLLRVASWFLVGQADEFHTLIPVEIIKKNGKIKIPVRFLKKPVIASNKAEHFI